MSSVKDSPIVEKRFKSDFVNQRAFRIRSQTEDRVLHLYHSENDQPIKLKGSHEKEGRKQNLDCSKFETGTTRNGKLSMKALEITLKLGCRL